MHEDEMTTDPKRRDFLGILLSGGVIAFLGAVLYPVLAYLTPPKQAEVAVTSVKAGKLSAIEKESGTIVRFGSKPVILIRTATGELRAYSATCTHLDCTVQFRKDMGLIWCACHNGKYDLNGRNVSGPPPRPLEEYRVTVQGDEVLISKRT
jgi:cytochrome b6-f complex iron-sulfur subunit